MEEDQFINRYMTKEDATKFIVKYGQINITDLVKNRSVEMAIFFGNLYKVNENFRSIISISKQTGGYAFNWSVFAKLIIFDIYSEGEILKKNITFKISYSNYDESYVDILLYRITNNSYILLPSFLNKDEHKELVDKMTDYITHIRDTTKETV